MIRLIHAQTIAGGILVDDIDDGLPNKEAYRLGRTANPKAYGRDGYANVPKQKCYVPYSKTTPSGSVIPGYINLNQTERVTFSAGQGKILKLANSGLLLQPVSLVAANIVAPVVSAATTSSTNFVITGTTLTSVTPDITMVTFAIGTGGTVPSPAVWTQSSIVAAGGTVGATSISIPMSAFATEPVNNNTVTVNANEQNSNTFTVSGVTDVAPVITAAHTVGSNFVITGTDFGPTLSLVTFAIGTGGTTPSPLTFTQVAILAAFGSVSATSISIPTAAFTGQVVVAGNTVKVHANALDSNVFAST